jgi:hypothetical protein
MKLLPDPRVRLVELAAARGVTLVALSEMIGRHPGYLPRYVGRGVPVRLRDDDRELLAHFFDVTVTDLGGDEPRWSKWRLPSVTQQDDAGAVRS